MKPQNRKICVVTGTRADYGLLRWVMQDIRVTPGLELQVLATGMHLSPEFGYTYREIEQDGFEIDSRVEMLTSSESPVGVAKSMGLGLIGFADALARLQPDLLLVLGDRFEIFSVVAAALVARIPVAHLHGGETSLGAFDESLRHAITKMSHLHFVATEEYRRRVLQLGELDEHVFMVGGLGVDSIARMNLMQRDELEASLGMRFGIKNLLITFHPVTLEQSSAAEQMQQLLLALDDLHDTELIFTLPNADTDGRALIQMIQVFCARKANAHVFTSLGQQRYFSCIAQVDGVVGNSSSGLLEVPSFHKGTINIGDRQGGRLQASSVINCAPLAIEIGAAIAKLYAPEFQAILPQTCNPYGDGGASARITEHLKLTDLSGILKKPFQNIPHAVIRD